MIYNSQINDSGSLEEFRTEPGDDQSQVKHLGGEHDIGDTGSSCCTPSGGEHIVSGGPTLLHVITW